MTPSFVQIVGSATGGSTTVTVTIASGHNTTVGNGLIAGVRASSGDAISSVSDSRGNTWTVDDPGTGTGGNASVASCVVASGKQLVSGDTITATMVDSSANLDIVCIEVAGIDTTGNTLHVDKHHATHVGTSTTCTDDLGGAITAEADEFVFTILGISTAISAASITATDASSGGAWTNLNSPGDRAASAYQIQSTGSGHTAAWTFNSANATVTTVTYKASSAWHLRDAGADFHLSSCPSADLTIPATTAGDLAVAILVVNSAADEPDYFTPPDSGWIHAAHAHDGANQELEIWIRPNISAGITTFSFIPNTTGRTVDGSVSTYYNDSGLSSVVVTDIGTNSSASSAGSLSVSTTGTAGTGDLAIAGFGIYGSASVVAWTTPTGFAPNASYTASATRHQANYSDTSSASGVITAVGTVNVSQTYWQGAIITIMPSIGISPSAVTGTTVIPAPNIAHDDLSIPPVSVIGTTAVPVPSVIAATGITVTMATIHASAHFPLPVVSIGTILSGPYYGTSGTDLGGGTGAWVNPSNASGTDDDIYATWIVP